MSYNIDNIINFMQSDVNNTIQIPKPILKIKVSDNTKLMFSTIFTECVKKQNVSNNTSETFKKIDNLVKEHISKITYSEIINECFCDRKRAKKIKRELNILLETFDITECFSNYKE